MTGPIPARRPVGRDERGNATLLALVVSMILVVVASIGIVMGSYFVAAHRTRGAADRAALAGARAYSGGADACDAAQRQVEVEEFPLRVEQCRVVGDMVEYVVSVDLAYSIDPVAHGLPDAVKARAHAGPVSTGSD